MFIVVSDLPGFKSSDQWRIDDAEAMALLSAPCLADLDATLDALKLKAVKAILRGALLRWNEVGNGSLTQKTESAGVFSVSESFDTGPGRRNMFWPSEITQLQGICSTSTSAGTASPYRSVGAPHAPWCALMMGAVYCSCGVDIAGVPIFEPVDG